MFCIDISCIFGTPCIFHMPCICIVQDPHTRPVCIPLHQHTESVCVWISICQSLYLDICQSYRIINHTGLCAYTGICAYGLCTEVYIGVSAHPHVCRIVYVGACVCVNTCLSIIQDLVCAWVSSHMHTGACLCGCLYAVTLVESVCKYIYILCRCMHVYAYDSA